METPPVSFTIYLNDSRSRSVVDHEFEMISSTTNRDLRSRLLFQEKKVKLENLFATVLSLLLLIVILICE